MSQQTHSAGWNNLDLNCWAIWWRVARPNAPVASSLNRGPAVLHLSPCFLVEEGWYPFSCPVFGGMLLMRRTFGREGLVGKEVLCDCVRWQWFVATKKTVSTSFRRSWAPGEEGHVASIQWMGVCHHPLMSESTWPSSRPGGGRDGLQLLIKIRESFLSFSPLYGLFASFWILCQALLSFQEQDTWVWCSGTGTCFGVRWTCVQTQQSFTPVWP